MTEPTIRQRMLYLRDLHTPLNPKNPWCPTCGHPGEVRVPCASRVAADAVLATLDASAIVNPAFSMHRGRERVIADPDGVPVRDEFDNPHNDHEAMWSRD